MPLSTAVQLQSTILKLQEERQEHENAIAEIDKVFEQFGIRPGVKRGRKPGSKNKKPSEIKVAGKAMEKKKDPEPGSAKEATTMAPAPMKAAAKSKPKSGLDAPAFVLGLIKRKGPLGAKRSDLSKAWGADGRKGAVHVILHNLTRSKKVKVTVLKDGDRIYKIV